MRFFDWLTLGINALTCILWFLQCRINRNLTQRLDLLRNFTMGAIGYEAVKKYVDSNLPQVQRYD